MLFIKCIFPATNLKEKKINKKWRQLATQNVRGCLESKFTKRRKTVDSASFKPPKFV